MSSNSFDNNFTYKLFTKNSCIGYRSKIWNNFENVFFSLIRPIFEKRDKSKFSWLALLFKHFWKIKTQLNMNEQEKKRQRIYDLLNVESKPKFFLSTVYKSETKVFFYRKRAF